MGISFAIPDRSGAGYSEPAEGERFGSAEGAWGSLSGSDEGTGWSFRLAKPQGALVNAVEKAGRKGRGIEPGDVVLRFDGKAISVIFDLPRIVGATRPGNQGRCRALA